MAQLIMVRCRCRVTVGGLVAGTPCNYTNHVLSFNVDKSRGQPGTCSVSIRAQKGEAGFASNRGVITIAAGQNGANNSIFYGYIRSVTISPCREYPNCVMLNVTGVDALSKLEGKKYTRRCRSQLASWVSIDGVAREGIRSGKLMWVPNQPFLEFDGGKLSGQSEVSKYRGASLPPSFEKPTTNAAEMVPMFSFFYTDSPKALSQLTGQTQPSQ